MFFNFSKNFNKLISTDEKKKIDKWCNFVFKYLKSFLLMSNTNWNTTNVLLREHDICILKKNELNINFLKKILSSGRKLSKEVAMQFSWFNSISYL